MKIRQERLPIVALEKIDDLCAGFEEHWRRDSPQRIEDIVGRLSIAQERDALLAELLVLEIDYRRQRSEHPSVDEYCKRFPKDEAIVCNAFHEDEEANVASRFQPPTVAQLASLFPTLDIIELLGIGGMGAVYKVRQKGLDRVAALKILPEEFGHDPKFALRFTREARVLARLHHPNIVSVFEFNHIESTYYFLMEYVDGSTLRELVQSRLLQPEQALRIVPHLCDALQYAHDQGVVHRDIKPENILLAKDGGVKIADFGLSRMLGNEGKQDLLTGTHQVMGTPHYIAPEQLEGTHRVDHRADIYSLGVVFYEMLTGELPIGRFSAPSEKVKIDVRLDDVVLRTLEKEPRRRYQHASQVKSDVQSIVAHEPTAMEPTVDLGNVPTPSPESTARSSLEQQELAGRLVLVRRELLGRVERALRPLFRGQLLQMLVGIAFIAIGVYCWAPNIEVPHRLASGIILQVYGTFTILAAGITCSQIKSIDYSQPVETIRLGLDKIRFGYLRFGASLGFAWWLLWIPLAVSLGFDAIALGPACWGSVLIGVVGIIVSAFFYLRLLSSEGQSANKCKEVLAGESLRDAYRALAEIEATEIR